MTAATSRLRRRGIGAGVAALVGLSGLGFAAMPAQAAAGFNPAATQVSGVDRFDTAAQIATKAFTTATTVVVANGDRAIDAQAGAYVAGLNNAPILLTQKSNVPTYTVDAIKKLGATKAIVLGDSNSVDATALAQMTAAGLTVQVVSGTDRFATAAAIYNLGTTKASTVFLARADLLAGQVSPDALAASPLSYDGTPVLLTNAASLPQSTADAIKNGGVKNVVVLGNAITDSVKTAVTALGATVTTIAGDDRSLTAQKIADYGVTQGKYQKTTATIANGDKIDALAAGPWAARNNAPILLTLGTNSLGTGTTNYLTANASTLTTGVAFGDTNSVPASLTGAAKTAGGGDVTASAYTLAATNGSALTTSQTATFSASGLTAGDLITIALVSTDSVKDGKFTLNTGNRAAALTPAGATGLNISAINGVPVGVAAATTRDFTANGSTVTFDVKTTGAGSFVPVVFKRSSASDTTLNANLDGVATETAAVGPSTGFTAPTVAPAAENADTTVASKTVASVNGSTSFVATGTTGSLILRDTDIYKLNSATITAAQFRSVLSVGDTVSVDYKNGATATNQSTFTLETDVFPDNTAATSALASATATGSVVTVKYTNPTSTTPGGTTFALQRAQKVSGVQGPWTTVSTGTVSATNVEQTYSETVADGTYVYRLVYSAPSFVGTAAATGTASADVVVPTTATVAAPAVLRTYTVTNTSNINALNATDVFKVVFDRPVTAPIQGAKVSFAGGDLTFTAPDATTVGASTFSVNSSAEVIDGASLAAGRVLTVTVLKDPASITLPATITGFTGIANATGAATVVAATGVVNG